VPNPFGEAQNRGIPSLKGTLRGVHTGILHRERQETPHQPQAQRRNPASSPALPESSLGLPTRTPRPSPHCLVPALTTGSGVTLLHLPQSRGRLENKHCQVETCTGCPHPETPRPSVCPLFPSTACATQLPQQGQSLVLVEDDQGM